MVRKKLRAHYKGPPLDAPTNQKAKTQRVDCESSGVSRVQSKHSDILLGGVWKEPLSHSETEALQRSHTVSAHVVECLYHCRFQLPLTPSVLAKLGSQELASTNEIAALESSTNRDTASEDSTNQKTVDASPGPLPSTNENTSISGTNESAPNGVRGPVHVHVVWHDGVTLLVSDEVERSVVLEHEEPHTQEDRRVDTHTRTLHDTHTQEAERKTHVNGVCADIRGRTCMERRRSLPDKQIRAHIQGSHTHAEAHRRTDSMPASTDTPTHTHNSHINTPTHTHNSHTNTDAETSAHSSHVHTGHPIHPASPGCSQAGSVGGASSAYRVYPGAVVLDVAKELNEHTETVPIGPCTDVSTTTNVEDTCTDGSTITSVQDTSIKGLDSTCSQENAYAGRTHCQRECTSASTGGKCRERVISTCQGLRLLKALRLVPQMAVAGCVDCESGSISLRVCASAYVPGLERALDSPTVSELLPPNACGETGPGICNTPTQCRKRPGQPSQIKYKTQNKKHKRDMWGRTPTQALAEQSAFLRVIDDRFLPVDGVPDLPLSGQTQQASTGGFLHRFFEEVEPDLSLQPEAPQPHGLLVPLLPYQRQALHWALAREREISISVPSTWLPLHGGLPTSRNCLRESKSGRTSKDPATNTGTSPCVNACECNTSQCVPSCTGAMVLFADMDTGRIVYKHTLSAHTNTHHTTDGVGTAAHGHAVVIATDDAERAQPAVLGGCGILADEMGLGKTLELIGIILSNPRPPTTMLRNRLLDALVTDVTGPEPTSECITLNQPEIEQQTPVRSVKTTLIVTPITILYQWAAEFEAKTEDLRVLVYDGVKQDTSQLTPLEIATYDVVITSYRVLAKDVYYARELSTRSRRHEAKYTPQRTVLVRVDWWRIVLDEAQMVESGVCHPAEMVSRMYAVHRWAVTGTPIGHQGIGSMKGLLEFISHPIGLRKGLLKRVGKAWKHSEACLLEEDGGGTDGLQAGGGDATKAIRCLLGDVMWRVSKKSVQDQLHLPPQYRMEYFLTLDEVETNVYHEVVGDVRKALTKISTDTNGSVSAGEDLSSLLLRLRQACVHPQMGVHGRGRYGAQHKTMQEVLETLTRQAENEYYGSMRKRCTNGMRLGLAHEFQHRYDLAIQQYNTVKEWIREGFTRLQSEHGSAPPVKYEALAETRGDTTIASAIESAPLDTCKSNVPVSAADKAGRVAPPAEAATEAPDEINTHKRAAVTDVPVNGSTHSEVQHKRRKIQAQEIQEQEDSGRIGQLDASNGGIQDGLIGREAEDEPEMEHMSTWANGEWKMWCALLHRVLISQGTVYLEMKNETLSDRNFALAESVRAKLMRQYEKIVDKEVKRLRQFTEEHAITLSRQNLRFQTYDPSMFLAGRTIIEELSHVCEKFNTGMTKIIKGREAMQQLLLEKELHSDYSADAEAQIAGGVTWTELQKQITINSRLLVGQSGSYEDTEQRRTVLNISSSRDDRCRANVLFNIREKIQGYTGPLTQTDTRLLTEVYEDASRTQKEMAKNIKILLAEMQEFSRVFNARIAFYKKLQELSDAVVLPDAPVDIEAELMYAMQSIDHAQAQVATTGGRYRYLASLCNEEKQAQAPKDRGLSEHVPSTSPHQPADPAVAMTTGTGGLSTNPSPTNTNTHPNLATVTTTHRQCQICLAPLEGSLVVLPCGHMYHRLCVMNWVSRYKSCPLCKTRVVPKDIKRVAITKAHSQSEPAMDKTTPVGEDTSATNQSEPRNVKTGQSTDGEFPALPAFLTRPSVPDTAGESSGADKPTRREFNTKIDTIVRYLTHLKHTSPGTKSIVFSQWQETHRIIGRALKTANVKYVDLNGPQKNIAIRQFNIDPTITVFLLSGKQQASGLTLVKATHCFLVEPLLHRAMEQQTINRIHRIGQTSPTLVHVFYTRDTVEMHIRLMVARRYQDTDKEMGASSLSNGALSDLKALTMEAVADGDIYGSDLRVLEREHIADTDVLSLLTKSVR